MRIFSSSDSSASTQHPPHSSQCAFWYQRRWAANSYTSQTPWQREFWRGIGALPSGLESGRRQGPGAADCCKHQLTGELEGNTEVSHCSVQSLASVLTEVEAKFIFLCPVTVFTDVRTQHSGSEPWTITSYQGVPLNSKVPVVASQLASSVAEC